MNSLYLDPSSYKNKLKPKAKQEPEAFVSCKTKKAHINQIVPFSIVDGPGNRSALFLQGCNYRCGYCHNPETINPCIHCLLCVPVCEPQALSVTNDKKVSFDFTKCLRCDKCIEACPHLSCPRTLALTPDEAFDLIKDNMPFIEGVTISGGECTLHHEWLSEFFLICKKAGLSCFIDSNGSFPFSKHPLLTSLTDGVMLDWKGHQASGMQNATGINYSEAAYEAFLHETDFLYKKGKLYEIRTVLVEGLFDLEACVKTASGFISRYQLENGYTPRYKLITYRKHGVRAPFSTSYEAPSPNFLAKLVEIAKANGVKEVLLV